MSLCSTCTKPTKGDEVFLCLGCNKVMHLSAKCTAFSEEAIAGIRQHSLNIFLLCTECVENGQRDVIISKMAASTPLMENPKLTELEQKVDNLVVKIDNLSFAPPIQRPTETENQLSEAPTVRSPPPKPVPNEDELGLRLRGVPESKKTNKGDQLAEDLSVVREIFTHLGHSGVEISDLKRLGQHRSKRKHPEERSTEAGSSEEVEVSPRDEASPSGDDPSPRTIIVKLKLPWHKRLILLSLSKLKTFKLKSIFVSRELTKTEADIEKKALAKRKSLIMNGIPRKELRIRNLILEQKMDGNEWLPVPLN